MATGLVRVPVDEPVQGRLAYLDYPGILVLSGFEQMQRFRRRELPYGPLWYLTGLDLVEFGIGSATFRLPVTGWLKSAAGLITGGALAFVADGALGRRSCRPFLRGGCWPPRICRWISSDLRMRIRMRSSPGRG